MNVSDAVFPQLKNKFPGNSEISCYLSQFPEIEESYNVPVRCPQKFTNNFLKEMFVA